MGTRKVMVASANRVKIQAVENGFRKMFPKEMFETEGVPVPSQISNQPRGDEETFQGACNRVDNVMKKNGTGDFFVGIESGIEEWDRDMGNFAWVVIRTKDGIVGKARTGTYFLPGKISGLVRAGKELSEAGDDILRQEHIGQKMALSVP